MGIPRHLLPQHLLPADLRIPSKPARAARGTGRVGAGKMASKLEDAFAYRWAVLGGPELVREYVFDATRKWRFDCGHPASKTAFELHGAIWTQGRHTRGDGFAADREKMNAAQVAGWVVIELTGGKDFSATNVERLIGVVRSRTPAELNIHAGTPGEGTVR